MKTFVVLGSLAVNLVAQTATVSNTADSGPGSLRAAILGANASGASSFTITIDANATAGSIVLGSLLPKITRSDVTIVAAPGAGRLLVDARSVTPPGGYAFDLAAARITLSAPCTLLVAAGIGIVVEGDDARLADVEAFANLGNAGNGVIANPGADNLIVGRLVADRFVSGLHLDNCAGARIADDGVSIATVTNTAGSAILVSGGSGHALGAFACSLAEIGVQATNCTNLVVGRLGNPRSSVVGARQQGVRLQNCSNTAVANVDLLGNGTVAGPGLAVTGGSGHAIRDLRSEANSSGGILLGDGASVVRVGPAVTTRGPSPVVDVGLAVRGASVVTIVDGQFGPDHAFGVALQPDAVGPPSNVTLCRSAIVGNRIAGILANRSFDSLVCSSLVAANHGAGVDAIAANLATAPVRLTVAGSILSGNLAAGLHAQNADTLRMGPGDRVDDNYGVGAEIYSSTGVVIDHAVSIDRNRGGGVWLVDSDDPSFSSSSLRENRGTGLWVLRCNNALVGPDIAVAATVGNGMLIEDASACRFRSSRITASTALGLVVYNINFAPTGPHVLQSVLLADHPGLAMFVANSQPVICELTTIAGNLRGTFNSNTALTLDSCIVRGNLLEDIHPAVSLTVRNTFHQNPPPAAGSSNTTADPQFVSPSTRDWRIQATSPAIGYANAQVAVPPGSIDAFRGARVVGALDAGAYEIGPHPTDDVSLTLSSTTMLHGGGGLAFHARHPASTAGSLALLLLEIGPPSGSFSVFGGTIPLAFTPALFVATNDPANVNTITTVAADGTVDGALLWGGRILPSVQNQTISLCSVALDLTPAVRSVTNVATFTIQ